MDVDHETEKSNHVWSISSLSPYQVASVADKTIPAVNHLKINAKWTKGVLIKQNFKFNVIPFKTIARVGLVTFRCVLWQNKPNET